MTNNPAIRPVRSGERVFCSSGKKHTFIVKKPNRLILIDGHSHIQSGACCPLPLIWAQPPLSKKVRPNREFLNVLTSIMGDAWRLQKKTTEQIAAKLVEEIVRTCGPESSLRKKADEEIFLCSIIMPMDLDYAHIAGFPSTGSMIYHEGEIEKWIVTGPNRPPIKEIVNGVFYYERTDAHAPEDKGKLIDVSGERPDRGWMYQHFLKQHKSTKNAIKTNPWQLIPMFFYDPRRWRNPSGGDMDKTDWKFGPWDFPFGLIATLRNAGIYIGFKMYTPLGHKPLDPRLPHLEEFYARCEADGIPILVHCSPGGMTTHDAELYYKLDGVDITQSPDRIVSCGYDPCTPSGYFYDNYVHPRTWRPVLLKYPKLKLCLAHLGGNEWENVGLASDWVEEIVNMTNPKIVQGRDEQGCEVRFENVYTDMACFNLDNSDVQNNVEELLRQMKNSTSRYGHLQDKLIFGVDWYLSIITKTPKYKEYVESFFTAMNETDEDQWVRSSLVNPAGFYGLDNTGIIDKINSSLKNENADASKRAAGYKNMLKIKDLIAQFHSGH